MSSQPGPRRLSAQDVIDRVTTTTDLEGPAAGREVLLKWIEATGDGNSAVEVGQADRVFIYSVAPLVGFAIDGTSLNTCPGQQE